MMLRRVVFSSSVSDLTRSSKPHRMLAHVSALLRTGSEGILNTVFPAECRLCTAPLTKFSRLPVCDDCRSQVEPFKAKVCDRCGESMPSDAIDLCTACRNAPPPFVTAKAIGPYVGKLRGLIHLLKYHRVLPAAAPLAHHLHAVVASHAHEFGDRPLIVPIPLHRNKLRARGFNQAEEIADALRRDIGFEMKRHILHRRKDTASQTGMTAHQRRENVRAAFVVRPRDKRDVAGRNIILVDDVMTTGATAAECARVLLRNGAAKVFVLTAARVSARTALASMAAGAQG